MKENEFTNQPITPDSLPRYETVAIQPIASSYWNIILINSVLVALIVGGGGAVLLFKVAGYTVAWLVLGAWLLFMLAQLAVRRIAFRQRGYALREHDVIYRKGLLGVVTTIVPFNRIQHVSINEGVLSRQFGLAQLQLFTAGGSAANMSIAGLPKEEAERIKAFIMGHIRPAANAIAEVSATESDDE